MDDARLRVGPQPSLSRFNSGLQRAQSHSAAAQHVAGEYGGTVVISDPFPGSPNSRGDRYASFAESARGVAAVRRLSLGSGRALCLGAARHKQSALCAV